MTLYVIVLAKWQDLEIEVIRFSCFEFIVNEYKNIYYKDYIVDFLGEKCKGVNLKICIQGYKKISL